MVRESSFVSCSQWWCWCGAGGWKFWEFENGDLNISWKIWKENNFKYLCSMQGGHIFHEQRWLERNFLFERTVLQWHCWFWSVGSLQSSAIVMTFSRMNWAVIKATLSFVWLYMGIGLLSFLWTVTFPSTVANQYIGRYFGSEISFFDVSDTPNAVWFSKNEHEQEQNQPIQQNIPFFVCPCFVSQPKVVLLMEGILHDLIGTNHPILYKVWWFLDFLHQQMVVKSHWILPTALVGGKASACPPWGKGLNLLLYGSVAQRIQGSLGDAIWGELGGCFQK